MKNTIKLTVILAIILIIVLIIRFRMSLYTTYTLGDYGVQITALNKFVSVDPGNNLLTLENDDGIVINAIALKGDFWSKNDLDTIMYEYLMLTSRMNYDCSITDVSYTKKKIDFKDVGWVEFTADRESAIFKVTTILTSKSNGYIAIEVFGDPEFVASNQKDIDNILNSIKFSENKHDYSQEVRESGDSNPGYMPDTSLWIKPLESGD